MGMWGEMTMKCGTTSYHYVKTGANLIEEKKISEITFLSLWEFSNYFVKYCWFYNHYNIQRCQK